jgi:CTP:molybdopterin cytidylyltransferase MocA
VPIPAIVTAGDRGAAKAVYGQSKVYLEVAGLPLVARVVLTLQRVPEVSEVWVVGDAVRLGEVLGEQTVQSQLQKPLHIIPQFSNLYENCWETFRRTLPGAPEDGRDPVGADLDWQVLYLSADLPFATPQEVSDFVRRGQSSDCDYALGLVQEESLDCFLPGTAGEPGVEVAFFNMREGRLKQSNLHLARPARMGNRHYVQEMYQHRHQRQFGNMLGLAYRLLRAKQGGLTVVFFYSIMVIGGLFDRWRFRRLANWVRQLISMERTDKALSRILSTRFRFVVTEVGGAAIDVDTEEEYDAICDRFEEWDRVQKDRAESLLGPLPLPEFAGTAETDEEPDT